MVTFFRFPNTYIRRGTNISKLLGVIFSYTKHGRTYMKNTNFKYSKSYNTAHATPILVWFQSRHTPRLASEKSARLAHNDTLLAFAVLQRGIGVRDNHELFLGKDAPRSPPSNPVYLNTGLDRALVPHESVSVYG
jgi:hypothetical protein